MTVNVCSQVMLMYHVLQGKENIAEEKNVKVKGGGREGCES